MNTKNPGEAIILEREWLQVAQQMHGLEKCKLKRCSRVEEMYATMSVVSWNTHGGLRLKLSLPEYRRYLSHFDVIGLQETHLSKELEECTAWLDNYNVYTQSRATPPNLSRPSGGVATLVRKTIQSKLRPDLGGDDIVTVELPSLVFVNAYMPPVSSPDLPRRSVQPTERLNEVLMVLHAERKQAVFGGDCNAKTAGDQTTPSLAPRCSADRAIDSRGRRLLNVLHDSDLVVLNGTEVGGPSSGSMTCYQQAGESTVDYIAVSTPALDNVSRLHVNLDSLEFSDHAALELTMFVNPSAPTENRRRDTQRHGLPAPVPPTRPHAPIDDVLASTVASAQTHEEAMRDIFGPVTCTTQEVRVWSDGSAGAGRAGAGLWYGIDAKANTAVRIAGPQTSDRAELSALAIAVAKADPCRNLRVFTDSSYVAGTFGPWAPKQAATGWKACANADVIKNIVRMIRLRRAPLQLSWVKAHAGNHGNEEADKLAKSGRDAAAEGAMDASEIELYTMPDGRAEPLDVAKVRVDMPPELAKLLHTDPTRADDREVPPENQRSRTKAQLRRRRMKRAKYANRQRVLRAAKEGEGSLWRALRALGDPRPERSVLGAFDLLPVFDIRMNRQLLDPVPGENSVHRDLVMAQANLIPWATLDLTPERFFSRPWSIEDLQDVKLTIQAHREDSATGWDDESYGLAMRIPNERLRELYNLALHTTTTPGRWLTTLLIGVLKKGKAGDVPENYRTIGLECVLLKILTLLIDKRVRSWAEARKILPRSQNGFRPTYRTNNNAFVLRCAAERAAAQGKPLYVASVDLTNAFPSVDRPLLWLKLQRLGMGGPVFDLYRHIYQEMNYIVRMSDGFSDAFSSDLGVLIGDPASPIMWNVFFADFSLPVRDDDVRLCGTSVSHLEHADDVILMSTTPEGLTAHLESLATWAASAFVRVNTDKTWALSTGPHRAEPFLFLNGRPITFKSEATYVGMTMGSREQRLFRPHYGIQARKAKRLAGLCFAVEGMTGSLPLEILRKVYSARVESHLISGADVCPDATSDMLRALETEQLLFLRRLLGVGSKSCTAALFSETDVLPIRYRRADLALRYLGYCRGRQKDELVALAMKDSIGLATLGCQSWYGDLQIALRRCSVALSCGTTLQDADIAAAQAELRLGARDYIHTAFATMPKLYLLKGRLADGTVGRVVTAFALRPYLLIERRKHRIALTRLLLSNHSLAVEALRHKTRYEEKVPRQLRICRLCSEDIEDEIHALFLCDGDPALDSKRRRLGNGLRALGTRARKTVHALSAGQYITAIQLMSKDREQAAILGRLAYEVLGVYDSVQLVRPRVSDF